jgi:glucosamine--fructose-6-phosphate aminotransferase (isomerizing)
MLREIHEQPATLATTLARYVDSDGFRSEACDPVRNWLRGCAGAIIIAASGSSRHAGLVAELLIEELSGIAVDVEYASEYTYSSEKVRHPGSVMVISQSGETADTLSSLRKAHAKDHETLAITNVATSTMAREATVSFPTEAGRERAVPATKSFTAQLLNLYLLALLAAEVEEKLTPKQIADRLAELRELPAKVAAQLPGWESSVREVAGRYSTAQNFLFLGRGVHNPIAREGALKLKESAYLHAEGYPSGELKHGPNALVRCEYRRRRRCGAGRQCSLRRRKLRGSAAYRGDHPAAVILLFHGDQPWHRRRQPAQPDQGCASRVASTKGIPE